MFFPDGLNAKIATYGLVDGDDEGLEIPNTTMIYQEMAVRCTNKASLAQFHLFTPLKT